MNFGIFEAKRTFRNREGVRIMEMSVKRGSTVFLVSPQCTGAYSNQLISSCSVWEE